MAHIKSTSTAVWWIKNPKKQRTQSWGPTLLQDMTDLFRNISLHGYNKLFDSGLLSYERLIWLCVHVSIFTFTYIALCSTWDRFVHQHFSNNLQDPLYPIENVPFPAVSICTNNRISRQAAEDYARELSKLDPRNNTWQHYMTKLQYFRSLYHTYQRSDDIPAITEFQEFLDRHATPSNETVYNLLNVMKKITPTCGDLLYACTIGGSPIDCDLFRTRLTMYGLCCTFNSDNSYKTRSFKSRFVDSDMGLVAMLNTSREDDTFSIMNMDGYIVMIHEPNDFPDISSGSSLEVFPIAREDTFISLRASLTDTSQDLRTFSPISRKCIFDDEFDFTFAPFNMSYSFSNCITRCRTRSVIALCNCMPFYIPEEILVNTFGVPFCDLNYVECIHRYQFKWRNVLTQRIDIEGLERESEEALYCEHCLPSCDDVRYSISMMSLPVDRISVPEGVDVSDFTFNISEMSVVRVYFSETTALFFKRVITNTWVESLSTVGNIVSICMGFSMVAFVETLYFLIKYLIVFTTRCFKQSNRKHKERKNSQSNSNDLYIYP